MVINAYTIVAMIFGAAVVYCAVRSTILLRELNKQLRFIPDWRYKPTAKKISMLLLNTDDPTLLSKIKEAALLWRLRNIALYTGVAIIATMALLKVPM